MSYLSCSLGQHTCPAVWVKILVPHSGSTVGWEERCHTCPAVWIDILVLQSGSLGQHTCPAVWVDHRVGGALCCTCPAVWVDIPVLHSGSTIGWEECCFIFVLQLGWTVGWEEHYVVFVLQSGSTVKECCFICPAVRLDCRVGGALYHTCPAVWISYERALCLICPAVWISYAGALCHISPAVWMGCRVGGALCHNCPAFWGNHGDHICPAVWVDILVLHSGSTVGWEEHCVVLVLHSGSTMKEHRVAFVLQSGWTIGSGLTVEWEGQCDRHCTSSSPVCSCMNKMQTSNIKI